MSGNITYAFNSTSEFYSNFLKNLSYAFGGGSYSGIFFLVFTIAIVHKIGGASASVPAGVGLALLLAQAGMLPAWVSSLMIITTGLVFAIAVYEHTFGRRS